LLIKIDVWRENSFYEFIYSCRDSIESPFPDLKGNSTIRAYETIKRMMEEISSCNILI